MSELKNWCQLSVSDIPTITNLVRRLEKCQILGERTTLIGRLVPNHAGRAKFSDTFTGFRILRFPGQVILTSHHRPAKQIQVYTLLRAVTSGIIHLHIKIAKQGYINNLKFSYLKQILLGQS